MTIKTYSKTISKPPAAPRKARSKVAKRVSMIAATSPLRKSFSMKRNKTLNTFSSAVPQIRPHLLKNPLNRNSSIEFRLIFSAAFALFLLTSVLERALPHKWSGRSDAGEIRKSVIAQAREAAHISVGYAFMG